MSLLSGCKAMALISALCLSGAAVAQDFGIGVEPEPERVPDPVRGETLFKECRKCHEVAPNQVKIGPSLAGIVGRRPGSVPAFGYSQDMIDFGSSGGVWDETTLDRFLTRPRALIGGTKMVFQGFRKPADREDLIAYLSTIPGF